MAWFRNIYICFVCLMLLGCDIYGHFIWNEGRRYIESVSSIKWPNDQSGIDSIISIDGFFCPKSEYGYLYDRWSFYDEGSVLVYSGWRNGPWAVDSLDIKEDWSRKGIYTISKDTLIANMYSRVELGQWELSTYKFLIINKDMLFLLDRKVKRQNIEYNWSGCIAYIFHRRTSKPKPKHYLKCIKWLWKDQEAWSEWMKNNGYKAK